MNRPLFRAAASTLAAAALTLVLLAVPASSPSQAASLSISDPNCDSFTLTGTAPNQTLNCIVSSVPSCTVGGPTSGQLGSAIALTASCSPAATSYAWTGGTCTTGQTCNDTQTVPGTMTYKVTGANNVGPGGPSAGHDVSWSNTVVAPSGCTISQSPSGTLTAGQSVTLTASCTAGTGLSWAWSGSSCFANGNTGAQQVGNVSASQTCKATATNSANPTGVTTSIGLTVGGSGGGGGGFNGSCTNVAGRTLVVNMPWGTSQLVQATGFGPNDIVVAQFKTSAVTTATGKGYIQAVEQGSSTSGRTAALSDTPCDLVGLTKVGGGTSAFGPNDNAPWATFSLVAIKSGYPILQPNTTYYFNITNSPNSSCGSTGVCDILITINKPTGS